MFKCFKYILFTGLIFAFLMSNFVYAQTKDEPINLYFFYSSTCQHCHEEALYLAQLQKEYGNQIKIYAFEVTQNRANTDLFKQFGQEYKVDISSVPLLFLGETYVIGYQNDEFTGAQIKNLINNFLDSNYHDLGRHVLFPDEECDYQTNGQTPCPDDNTSKIVKIPILGEIDLQNTPLFFVSVILGALDGFNPCAMWVLLFLISLLLSVDSCSRRWVLGLTFIIASGLVYFLFMVAWLNMFLFIGYLLIVRIIIGALAIIFGIYSLNKFVKNTGTCEVAQSESRQKILQNLKNVALRKNLLPAIIGIIALAFAVNLIELACSAGFPAIYTKILASQNLPSLNYYLYILLYIFFFLIDDIIVFIIAMVTLKLTGVDAKYSKYSNLIGGLIILILGALIILKPEWLMF